MTLAVVVCTRDRPGPLDRCLQSLRDEPADELIVIDSASGGPATAETATRHGARCLPVAEPGLSRARNAGLAASHSDIVAFLDDDCTAVPGWASAVRTAMTDPEVAFVTGQVRAAGDGVPLSVTNRPVARRFRAGDDPSAAGHGANFAVRRGLALTLGGFDELLGAGAPLRAGEDTDFMWRALAAGWTGRYDPAPTVVHEQWRSRAAALRTSFGYGVGGGAVQAKVRRLAARNGGRPPVLQAGSLGAVSRQAVVDARHRYPFGTLVCAARAAGIVSGRVRGGRLALRDGLLVPR